MIATIRLINVFIVSHPVLANLNKTMWLLTAVPGCLLELQNLFTPCTKTLEPLADISSIPTLNPQSLATTILFSYEFDLHRFHIVSVTMEYLSFCAWLISLSIMSFGPSTLSQMAEFPSFLGLNNIAL